MASFPMFQPPASAFALPPNVAQDPFFKMHPPQLFPQPPQIPGGSFIPASSGFMQPTPTPQTAPFSMFGAPNFAMPQMAMPQVVPQQPTAMGANPLRDSLNRIESDPEGARLIQAARAKKVFIQVGNTGGGNTLGSTQSDANGQTSITVRDPANIKTIVHELVHAVSGHDGNSREEEGVADVIGSRIANRLGGASAGGLAGTDQQIFLNKQQFYPQLAQANAIRQTLAGLGFSLTV